MSPPLPSAGSLNSVSVLNRSGLESLSAPTPVHAALDGLTLSFADQTTDWRSLAALTAGGMAYRAGRIGVMGLGSGSTLRALSVGVGLTAEVSAFEGSHRALHFSEPPNRNLWRWSGPGGIRQGFLQSFVTFSTLKGAGRLAQGEGLIAQHLFQDTAMVLGHQATGALGFTPRPAGGLAEQFLHAEAVNLQLGAGMALGCRMAPAAHALERGLELSIPRPSPVDSPDTAWEAAPQALATVLAGPERTGNPPPFREINDLMNTPMQMSAIKDLWGRLTGRPAEGARPSDLPTLPALPPEVLGYFQSYYDAQEVFALGSIEEGQQRTIGRSLATRGDVFPGYYRNISRAHLELRILEGRLEVKAAPGSFGVRINGSTLTPFFWYLLRHGDFVEFIGEGHLHREGSPADFLGSEIQDGNRPAVFRFFRAGETTPVPSIAMPPERAPLDTRAALAELKAFQDRLGGMINLYSQALRETDEYLKGLPPEQRVGLRLSSSMLNVDDIVRLHRHLGGAEERTVTIDEESDGILITRSVQVPHIEGLLSARLEFFQEALNQHEALRGLDAEVQAARRHLASLTDQFDRMHRIVQIYRRFFETPHERALLDAVEAAYQGLNVESVLREARVRSETRSLDVTLTRAEREAWTREFLETVLEPRIVRNVMILTGQIPNVQGRPVGGSFYRAVSQGTVCDGLRSVRALVDLSTGEFIAFLDETPASRSVRRQMEAEGRPYEEISLLVNVVETGRIAQVIVSGSGLRASVRNALHGLVGLQVLPQGPARLREGGGFDAVFGLTEYRDMDSGEIWRMNFPVEADSPEENLYRVAAITPLRESAGPEGLTQWTLVTLAPTLDGVPPLQIFTRTHEVLSLRADSLVRAHRMR